jgi:hypothetical protein
MRLAEHIACMGIRDMYTGFWWESQKERGRKGDLDMGGRIILEWILARYDWVVWTGFI